jgi:small GTP-binding protein
MNDIEYKLTYKISVIGDGRVGKTSLIKKFTKGSFQKDYIKTIGAQFSVFDKMIDGAKIRLFFWDIAGQDDFHFLRNSFFKNSKASIIVFSLEENELGRNSFKNVIQWYKEIQQYCGKIPVVLFANKVDLVDEKRLDTISIQNLVKDHDILDYYLTSAKTGQGVIEAFNTIINKLYNQYKSKTIHD